MKEHIKKKKQELLALFDQIEKDLNKIDILSEVIKTETKQSANKAIEDTVSRVCDYFEVPVTEVYKKYPKHKGRPPKEVVKARGIISWVLHEVARVPKGYIGNLYGKGWEYQSVNYHLGKIRDDLYIYSVKGKDTNGTIKHFKDLNIPIQ